MSGDAAMPDQGDLHVRSAAQGDVDLLARIWVEGWNDAHALILPPELARFRTLDDLRARLVKYRDNTVVVDRRGRPVGFAMVKADELDQLYVSRDARGTGASGALVVGALDRIRCAGHRRAWLACAIGNDRAARFYRKSGWSRTGIVTIRLETQDGPVPLDVWRFEIGV